MAVLDAAVPVDALLLEPVPVELADSVLVDSVAAEDSSSSLSSVFESSPPAFS